MTNISSKKWIIDFGLEERKPPSFFSSVDQLDDVAEKAPHPHALRRAFNQLAIDGVLCIERSPVIYFHQTGMIDERKIAALHRSFWNQGIAPILVIVAPEEVRVYSGLIPPEKGTLKGTEDALGLVETLGRVHDQLQSFLLSVESGEYFRTHRPYFNPEKRVDRSLLRNLETARRKLGDLHTPGLEPQTLDALLCRLVFTCYLFDRCIIDESYLIALRISGAKHLRDILAKRPRSIARKELYSLFERLGRDFNGDLFTADLSAENRQILDDHLDILDHFFSGGDIQSGQLALWPYEFGYIPIETISAIYEHFLKAAGEEQKKEFGAFYTPRFLAEFVLDIALERETSLLDKKFLDPSCGSGIFLVGLFNRLAQEWKLKNPNAPYDRRAEGLMEILQTNVNGIDKNIAACQISAFSLYLAFLDQLSPPDIKNLLGKWKKLPYLVSIPGKTGANAAGRTIRCSDFFTEDAEFFQKAKIIVGNPPWGSAKDPNEPAVRWCSGHNLPQPDKQMATAFIWKAPRHLEDGGKVCFVLPHGILFNHGDKAIGFQQSLFRTHAVDRVVNLTDYQFFLFEESRAPALVMSYRKEKPSSGEQIIEHWAPKTDWTFTQAEIITILPQDRSRITVREVLDDLKGEDAPLIWKRKFWATPRDWRLLDRLSLMNRMRDIVKQPGRGQKKRWLIAEGFQPFGDNDPVSSKKTLKLPTSKFIKATHQNINLFIMPNDCETLPRSQIEVRRLIRNTLIFKAPHVLVTQGFSHIAFADFDVSFRHALRGIHGPDSDRDLLIFLAAYLRSDLAKYFLSHTSSNWGVSRAKVHVEELLRLPFPLPRDMHDPKRCYTIIRKIANSVLRAANETSDEFADREAIVCRTQESANRLIEEYFDIDEIERMIIADTINTIIPSFRPSRTKSDVPTLQQSTKADRQQYLQCLCNMLNSWASEDYRIHGTILDSPPALGFGLVVLEKSGRNASPAKFNGSANDISHSVSLLQRIISKKHGTYELVRGLKIFHRNLLYITKPLGRRFWMNTAALNDADEIAATILMRSARK